MPAVALQLNEGVRWDKHLAFFAVVGCLISTVHIAAFYYSHDTPKWLVFDVASSLYIFYALNDQRRIQLTCLGTGGAILLAVMLISLSWAPHKAAGLEFILRFMNSLLLAYCLARQFSYAYLVRLLITTVFCSATVFCALFIIQRYVLNISFNVGTFSPFGFMNNAGQVFNIWIPALVLYCYYRRHQRWELLLGIAVLMFVVSILMEAGTRGTIIALTLSELVIFLITLQKNRKQALVFLTITTVMILGIAAYQLSDSLQSQRLSAKVALMKDNISSVGQSRVQLYQNTWAMAADNPYGVGINNFEYVHPKYAHPGTAIASPMVDEHTILRTPHNIVLKLYSELGYLGGSLFCAFLGYIFFSALYSAFTGTLVDKWLFVAVCATLIHSLLSAVFLTPASLFFSVLLFAAVNRRTTEKVSAIVSVNINRYTRYVFLLIPLLATASAASEYHAYQGRMHFDAGRLEQALQFNPYNDRALYDLSQVRLRRERDVQGSLQALDRFVALYPYHISGLFSKAERHYQLGELDNAQNTLDIVLDFYPGFKKARRLQQDIQRKKLAIRRMKGK